MSAPSTTPSERPCFLLVSFSGNNSVKEAELQQQLESKDESQKLDALQKILYLTLNGEPMPKLLMPIIKYCLHTESHELKKLLLLYWDVVEKKNKEGHLLHEMILVCNAIKNYLNHPNEYVRGFTLRFLCKMREPEILESLIPSIQSNLEHRHSYVRKYAVLCVCTVFKSHPDLIPDAPQLIEKFLELEFNPLAKRNAFMCLFQVAQDRAVAYLNGILDQVPSLDESFQLVVLELIRKVCRSNPLVKSQFAKCVFSLLTKSSNAVAYEGANTLCALFPSPIAVRAAVGAYTKLLQDESDNNIKLVIIGRLAALKKRHEKTLQEMLLDIMRVLSSPNMDIRRKTLELTMELVSARNVAEVVQVLKKELAKTEAANTERGAKSDDYRKLLVDAMHQCAVKFPDVVGSVVHLLMNYLGDESTAAGLEVVHFVREIVEEYPALRESIITKLLEAMDSIRSSEVYRVALWVLGEYAVESSALDLTVLTLRQLTGALPLLAPPVDGAAAGAGAAPAAKPDEEPAAAPVRLQASSSSSSVALKKPVVLADGTYASQAGVMKEEKKAAPAPTSGGAGKESSLRSMIVKGDYFLAAALANTMTKLLLRFSKRVGLGSAESNEESAKCLALVVSMIRLGTGKTSPKPIDADALLRLTTCVRVLLDPKNSEEAFLSKSRENFARMLEEHRRALPKDAPAKVEVVKQVDDLISIRQISGQHADAEYLDDDDSTELSKAVGHREKSKSKQLNRVYQLTGYGDPVYAEAVLTVVEFDILLDILVVNQTNQVLQNLCVELQTSSDLKVVDRPQPINVPAFAVQRIAQNIKVSSTESGVIFGNIVYDAAAGAQKTIVVLNNINMDIMDYIAPASCTDAKFRTMWAEFEWENKVAVSTDISDLNEYLTHLLSITNMKCMTPQTALSGASAFLAANLYAKSIFGEDALLNLSIERQPSGKIEGYIRIRSKTQGIALSLGDKITSRQRGISKKPPAPAPAAVV